ncbi:leucyl/phenylalanyl-tRNA--protein transferase [Undibacterium curvum]|uniref:Leucyl/phenylalanyl-tRNA--protein transferase n=1 Tax=Undibacterium curvum TaxID=2762294 RepID=A0ABR7A3K2_9BURK|nr:leucyl/phenylalanyl-tRNA--protein transferase [Undibacterium curvum]MBC3931472.1 leucyl/phenylalanyl-tRNA--protein transferase [Undibacterium curvum]
MIPWLEQNSPFPDVSTALTEAQGAAGLLAAGADLSAERLLLAYRSGIFPWFSEGQPILWWSTDPRMVLKTADFKLSDSLRKKLNKISDDPAWEIRFDSAFEAVMRACAAPRKDGHGTWISEDIIQGYGELHRKGYAHSSELWLDNTLVGGAYGVCIGKMFYGESMFARVTDASKIALSQLVFFLREQGVQMIDCQQETAHLSSLGARPISRTAFLEWLSIATEQPAITNWQAPGIRSK